MPDIDLNAMRAYVLDKFIKEGDFDFLKAGGLDAMVNAMLELDAAYMASLAEDAVYDDDEAYERLFTALQARYPQYKMYCLRLAEDYLDFAEEYLASVGAIEWE
ncbi:MAG: hypothetical protein ABFC62_07975 [Clostridiaceae bacterium]|nr:hypothetical protein [Eubacteriales bacterium]